MKVDINLLPEEYRPKRWALPLTVGLIIAVLAVGTYCFGFPVAGYSGLYQKNAAAHSELEQLQSELDSINAETQKVLSDPTMKQYEEQIAEARVEIDALKTIVIHLLDGLQPGWRANFHAYL